MEKAAKDGKGDMNADVSMGEAGDDCADVAPCGREGDVAEVALGCWVTSEEGAVGE